MAFSTLSGVFRIVVQMYHISVQQYYYSEHLYYYSEHLPSLLDAKLRLKVPAGPCFSMPFLLFSHTYKTRDKVHKFGGHPTRTPKSRPRLKSPGCKEPLMWDTY